MHECTLIRAVVAKLIVSLAVNVEYARLVDVCCHRVLMKHHCKQPNKQMNRETRRINEHENTRVNAKRRNTCNNTKETDTHTHRHRYQDRQDCTWKVRCSR